MKGQNKRQTPCTEDSYVGKVSVILQDLISRLLLDRPEDHVKYLLESLKETSPQQGKPPRGGPSSSMPPHPPIPEADEADRPPPPSRPLTQAAGPETSPRRPHQTSQQMPPPIGRVLTPTPPSTTRPASSRPVSPRFRVPREAVTQEEGPTSDRTLRVKSAPLPSSRLAPVSPDLSIGDLDKVNQTRKAGTTTAEVADSCKDPGSKGIGHDAGRHAAVQQASVKGERKPRVKSAPQPRSRLPHEHNSGVGREITHRKETCKDATGVGKIKKTAELCKRDSKKFTGKDSKIMDGEHTKDATKVRVKNTPPCRSRFPPIRQEQRTGILKEIHHDRESCKDTPDKAKAGDAAEESYKGDCSERIGKDTSRKYPNRRGHPDEEERRKPHRLVDRPEDPHDARLKACGVGDELSVKTPRAVATGFPGKLPKIHNAGSRNNRKGKTNSQETADVSGSQQTEEMPSQTSSRRGFRAPGRPRPLKLPALPGAKVLLPPVTGVSMRLWDPLEPPSRGTSRNQKQSSKRDPRPSQDKRRHVDEGGGEMRPQDVRKSSDVRSDVKPSESDKTSPARKPKGNIAEEKVITTVSATAEEAKGRQHLLYDQDSKRRDLSVIEPPEEDSVHQGEADTQSLRPIGTGRFEQQGNVRQSQPDQRTQQSQECPQSKEGSQGMTAQQTKGQGEVNRTTRQNILYDRRRQKTYHSPTDQPSTSDHAIPFRKPHPPAQPKRPGHINQTRKAGKPGQRPQLNKECQERLQHTQTDHRGQATELNQSGRQTKADQPGQQQQPDKTGQKIKPHEPSQPSQLDQQNQITPRRKPDHTNRRTKPEQPITSDQPCQSVTGDQPRHQAKPDQQIPHTPHQLRDHHDVAGHGTNRVYHELNGSHPTREKSEAHATTSAVEDTRRGLTNNLTTGQNTDAQLDVTHTPPDEGESRTTDTSVTIPARRPRRREQRHFDRIAQEPYKPRPADPDAWDEDLEALDEYLCLGADFVDVEELLLRTCSKAKVKHKARLSKQAAQDLRSRRRLLESQHYDHVPVCRSQNFRLFYGHSIRTKNA